MPDTAQFILNRLTEWGIKRIYGYPGDGINGLMGAFHEVGDKLEFIQTRHEEIASFAACAHVLSSDFPAQHRVDGVNNDRLTCPRLARKNIDQPVQPPV